MRARAMSEKGGGVRQGHPAPPAPEAVPRQCLTAGKGLSDTDLDRWLADPKAGAVTIQLVCDAETTLVVTDPVTVEAMLRVEQRRRQTREAASA